MAIYQHRQDPIPVELPEAGLAVVASRHVAGFAMNPTRHAYHKLLCFTAGDGEVLAAQRRVPVARGTLVYVPPDREHRLEDHPQNPVSLLVACFDGRFLARALALHGAERAPWPPLAAMTVRNAYYREHIEQCLLAMHFEQSERRPGWQGAMAGHFLTLMAFQSRAADEAPPEGSDLRGCVAWLDHHFDQPVSIDDLARRCGLTYRRFTESFRRLTGCSALAYQARLRIRHAVRLLEGGAAIADAARATGYSDLAHFYRQFKQQQGLPPGRWLQREGQGA